jgi:hypothetical protein
MSGILAVGIYAWKFKETPCVGDEPCFRQGSASGTLHIGWLSRRGDVVLE